MQRLEVSGVVRLLYRSLGVKGLIWLSYYVCRNYMYIYAYLNIYIYIYSMQYCTKCGFYSIVGSTLVNLRTQRDEKPPDREFCKTASSYRTIKDYPM